MLPGKKGRLSPDVLDELQMFIDSQAAADGSAGGAEGGETEYEVGGEEKTNEETHNAPSVEVEIESKPKDGGPQGNACPYCGHVM